MRLIDADKLKLEFMENGDDHTGYEIHRIIDESPAVDAVTVVRCRDCELWNDWDSAGKESLGNYVYSCAHWSVEDGAVLYTRPTDYCSYGERKGGDE